MTRLLLFWYTLFLRLLGKNVQGSGQNSLTHVLKVLCGSIPGDTVPYLSWLLTSISWLPWHCTSQVSQNSIIASHQSRQRWKSDLAQPVILSSSPAELSAQVDVLLSSMVDHDCSELSGVRFGIWTPYSSGIASWSSGILVWEPCSMAATCSNVTH